MNKLNVLAKNSQTYFIKRLTEEVGKAAVTIINPWIKGLLTFEGDLWVRTTAVYGGDQDLDFCRQWHGRIINPVGALELFRTKSHQYEFYQKEAFPHLPWISLHSKSLEQVLEACAPWGDRLLLKPDRGQGGWGIRVLSRADLQSWWDGPDHDYLLQPYIVEKREFRYFFCSGENALVLERIGELAANFAQGGKARMATLPVRVNGVLQNLVEQSGAFYGAIDFFLIKDELFILELNVCPGLEQLESVSGENILKKLLRNLSP